MCTIDRAILHLHTFASNDDARQNLSFINLRQVGSGEGKTLLAEATDGHRAAQLTCHDTRLPWEGVKIPASCAKAALRGARKTTTFELSVEIDPNTEEPKSAKLIRLDVGSRVAFDFDIDECVFPDVNQVMPARIDDKSDATAAGVFGFNAGYVGDIGTYLKRAGFAPGVRVQPPETANDPIRLDSKLELGAGGDTLSLSCVVMPVRL